MNSDVALINTNVSISSVGYYLTLTAGYLCFSDWSSPKMSTNLSASPLSPQVQSDLELVAAAINLLNVEDSELQGPILIETAAFSECPYNVLFLG
jgi:hypothetical protein